MAFRLIVSEAPDLTKIRVVGRLSNDAVAPLSDACERATGPVVVDLSELTTASEASLVLLRGLMARGVHLVGGGPYVQLLLEPPIGTGIQRPTRRPGGIPGRRRGRP